MAQRFQRFLLDAYERRPYAERRRPKKDAFIQIDDQDDNDSLLEFCNIFVTVTGPRQFTLELVGRMPITKEMADLAEIYNGAADTKEGILVLNLNLMQLEAVIDLAGKIRRTAFMGGIVGNPNWARVSARTISSLHRFVRICREYQRNRGLIS